MSKIVLNLDFDTPSYGYKVKNIFEDAELQVAYGLDSLGRKIFIVQLADTLEFSMGNSKLKIIASEYNDSPALIGTLLVASHDEIFWRLVEDLASQVIEYEGESPRAIQRRIIARLKMWYQFFKPEQKRCLSEEAQRGLIGELLFLIDLHAESGSIQTALDCWGGPEGAAQDFVYNDMSIEVKSLLQSAKTVTISSLEQLEAPQGSNFLLIHSLQKEHSAMNGANEITLQGLVDRVLDLAHGINNCTDLFLDKLFEVGYSIADQDDYKTNVYKLIDTIWYEVSDGFPRILRSEMAEAIISAKYDISLNAIEEYKLSKGVF